MTPTMPFDDNPDEIVTIIPLLVPLMKPSPNETSLPFRNAATHARRQVLGVLILF